MRMWRWFALWLMVVHAAVAQPSVEPLLDPRLLPPMRAPGAASFRDEFLLGSLPRAWAVASDGSYGGAWGSRSPEAARAAALASCASKGGTDCALYAADLDVVWRGRAAPHRAVQAPLIAGEHYAFVPDERFFWFGPQAAKGVVVWGHGYGGADDDVRGRQPPGFLRALNDAGYDVVRFDRHPFFDYDVDGVASWLRDGLAELRRRGWKTIVDGGQSRGGWNALQMLQTPGSADAVIAASAAAFGTNAGNLILRGETQLYRLASSVPPQSTRLVYIQFRDDPYAGDEARRASRIREIVGPNVAALLLIDQPDGIAGHGGAYATRFAERFGNRIQHFVTDATPHPAC